MATKIGYRKRAKELGKPELEETIETAETLAAISAIADQEGGKILVKNLTTDCVNAIEQLCNKYSSLTHAEMIALCATLRANLDLVHVITRSKENKRLVTEELEEALKE